ncbi:hypothetical protein [Salisediminibacterium selenitireducens]|uniref:Uncharacterized protein n=1 Tax=Bacillus selenitireducens (strain ATCC 700615 / DSM 15326 / MLS10) TaxID=439292 RepID=D6XZX3_BACIE|nr:hypothetical protein [Salisediminibacterium selenitireducens]ADI00475.1 hypothetical protein Bsel_2993 [[Bacillus] selenitireducens MLS10]
MTYHAGFNNPLAIWTAFGGKGEMEMSIPVLGWTKRYRSYFGYSSTGGETRISVFDNGNAQIAVYYAKNPNMSYFNHSTGEWTLSPVTWWNHGEPEILHAADGVFLAKITGFGNIIASFDGITWHNAGYCTDASNAMVGGAYDVTTNAGIVTWWSSAKPLYHTYDDLTERTEWPLITSAPVLRYVTHHKGRYVGVESGDRDLWTAMTNTPGFWAIGISEDSHDSRYMFITSVHNRLFVMRWRRPNNDDYVVTLCVVSDNVSQITETNLEHVGPLADNRIPNPQNILWMASWGKYVLFNEGTMHLSDDGLYWEAIPQPGLTTQQYETFGGAIYVPGHGFYIKGNGYVYEALHG